MPRITIDKDKCKGCSLCVSFCPKGCIRKIKTLNKRGLYPVEFQSQDLCIGCSFCAIICPDCCIEVYR